MIIPLNLFYYPQTKKAKKIIPHVLLYSTPDFKKLNIQKTFNFIMKSFTLKDFHNKIDKFKIEEYLLLSACDKSKIRNMVFKLGSIREAANSSVELAVDYKNFLDKKYGKENYVFI